MQKTRNSTATNGDFVPMKASLEGVGRAFWDRVGVCQWGGRKTEIDGDGEGDKGVLTSTREKGWGWRR